MIYAVAINLSYQIDEATAFPLLAMHLQNPRLRRFKCECELSVALQTKRIEISQIL